MPVNSLGRHVQFLEQCLARVPLNKNTQDVLVRYRRFLDTLVVAGEGAALTFDAPGPLAEAVEILVELGDLDLDLLGRDRLLANG